MALLAEIGVIDRAIEAEEQRLQDALRKAEEAARPAIQNLRAQIEQKFLALKAYVETNQSTLLAKNRRSVRWPTGVVGFRDTPLATSIARGKADCVVEQLEALGLIDCVTVKKSVDKDAVKKRRDEIEGKIKEVKFTKSTEFYAQAGTATVEHVKRVGKPRVDNANRKGAANAEG